MIDPSLTRNYLGTSLAQSPVTTNTVIGTAPGRNLVGKRGVSNTIQSDGSSTMIGGGSGDTFQVKDLGDVVITGLHSGINTVQSWATRFVLPSNVQNLVVENGGVGIGNSLANLLVAQGTGTSTLVAGTGNDVLIGNGNAGGQLSGGNTTFVVTLGSANDVISNFENGTDVVQMDGFTRLAKFSDVQAAMTQVGSDVVITLAPAASLTLRNETIARLSAHDIQIATPISVASITTASLSNALGVGSTVLFNIAFNGAVTLAGGIPTIALNDGGTATYKSGSGTSNLVFSYTVGAGENTADLAFANTNALALQCATLKDAWGVAVALPAANGFNPTGILQINTVNPVVTGLTMTSTSNVVHVGGVVTLSAAFSEVVYVNGATAPTITLNDGGVATYVSGSGTTNLTLSYTVGVGENTANLAFASSGALNMHGSTITGVSGNAPVVPVIDGYHPSGSIEINGGISPAKALSQGGAVGNAISKAALPENRAAMSFLRPDSLTSVASFEMTHLPTGVGIASAAGMGISSINLAPTLFTALPTAVAPWIAASSPAIYPAAIGMSGAIWPIVVPSHCA